jgi:AcrR family transcriptional regulator
MSSPVPLDRRQRRRLETIEEVLDVAIEIMAEQGVAGLSLGELARRMGIRPPSLYVYFPSKNAIYDAVFGRGARLLLDAIRASVPPADDDESIEERLLQAADVFGRWSLENAIYTQLMFWRPVPGFTPSAEAYAPAVETLELLTQRFAGWQRAGRLRSDVPVADIVRDWTVLTSGVISQQLSNAPDEPYESGRFTSATPALVEMFARYYGTQPPAPRAPAASKSSPPKPRPRPTTPTTPKKRSTSRARQR